VTPADVVAAFVAAINAHDPARIAGLCTDDHRFVDAHGGVVNGPEVLAAWTGYFRFMPHYGVEAERILADGDTVAVFGQAWGGLNAADPTDRSWRRPAAWRARVRGEKIALWQVFVDTKAVFDLM
jgi:ketosteroid isomerase-like protein